MGTTFTVIPRDEVTSHGVTVGMGSNADGNTAVKWTKDEQCSLVTLLTVCCSCMDCKLCSIVLEMDQNLLLFMSRCTH